MSDQRKHTTEQPCLCDRCGPRSPFTRGLRGEPVSDQQAQELTRKLRIANEQIAWMVRRCNEAMGDGFSGTPNSAVAAVCDALLAARAPVPVERRGERFWREGRPGAQVVCECRDCGKTLGSPGEAHWCLRARLPERPEQECARCRGTGTGPGGMAVERGNRCIACHGSGRLPEQPDQGITVIERKHQAYPEPLGGGEDGYQGACHDCDWRGTIYPRSTLPEPGLKDKARREAVAHETDARLVREVPHQILAARPTVPEENPDAA